MIVATPTPKRRPSLNALDVALQALTVVMLVAAIVAVQARMPCYLYLAAAPILALAAWACAGLVIDRQTLRGPEPAVAAPQDRGAKR